MQVIVKPTIAGPGETTKHWQNLGLQYGMGALATLTKGARNCQEMTGNDVCRRRER